MFHTKTVLGLLSCAAVLATHAADVKIKDGANSVPLTKIIHSASQKDKETAQEAARIITRLTGKTVEIIRKDSVSAPEAKGALVIGNHLLEKDAVKKELNQFLFGYVVKVSNGAVILGGTDSIMRANGLYRLFERQGMKFYIMNLREWKLRPGMETLETIPNKKEIVFQDSYSEKCRFARTASDGDGTRGNPRTTKEAKAKVYGQLWTGHAHDLLVPYSIYGKTHPEYYALLSNGKRLGKVNSMGVHLCMSNPDLPAIAAANIVNWIDQQPWATYFDISPSDGPNWCTCKNCAAMDKSGNGRAERLWIFNNKVAEIVKKKYPDKKLVCLAYTPNSEMPPASGKIADNLVVLFAPYCWGGARSQYHSLNAPVNKIAYQNFQAWMKILKPNQMIGFEYPPSYYFTPSAGMKPMFEKLKLMAEYPQVFGFDYCGYSRNSFYRLSLYVLSELEWNPKLDTNQLIDNFMKQYYGAAAPFMRAIYDLNAEIAEKKPHYARCEYYAPGFLADNRDAQFYALFEKAEKSVKSNPELLKRVLIEKAPYLYIDLKENNPANGKASFDTSFPARLQEFLMIAATILDPEYKTNFGRSFVSLGYEGNLDKLLLDICGFVPEKKDIYNSKLVQDFLKSTNPADFLKQNCRLEKAQPYGIGINLAYGTNVIMYTQKKQVHIAAENAAPMAELWGGDKATENNTFKVIALKNAGSAIAVIEFLDNPYDGALELTAKNENAPCEAVVSVQYNHGKNDKRVFETKVKFDSPDQWVVFRLPAPAKALRHGHNNFIMKNGPIEYGSDVNANDMKIAVKTKGNQRLLIRKMQLLY